MFDKEGAMRKSSAFITCLGGAGTPSAPAPPPPKPTEQDARVTSARDTERRRRRAAASSTVLTSFGGVQGQPQTQGKTLLGQ